MITQGLGYAPAAAGIHSGQRGGSPLRAWWEAYLPPAFITLVLLVAEYNFKILEYGPWRTLTAIGTAMLVDAILGLLVVGRVPHLASAYISGISVGILVRST